MDSNSTKRMPIRSNTTIQDLNDKVLRETFRHLDSRGLCTVADVCSTFKKNAVAEFSARQDREYVYLKFGAKSNSKQSLSMLRNFGSVIRCLRIYLDRKVHSARITTFITQHCGESLKGLSLQNFGFSINVVSELRPLLSQLQEITICDGYWESEQTAADMFSSCREVRRLSFQIISNFYADYLGFPLRGNIPKLISLTLQLCENVHDGSIGDFLKENPQLMEIEIRHCRRVDTAQVIRSIALCCPEIERIKLVPYDQDFNITENAKYLKRSTALKSLSINCAEQPFSSVLSELIAAHISLECLELFDFQSDQRLVKMISGMRNLKKLALCKGEKMKLDDILKIVGSLNELVQLKVSIKTVSPADLVKIVRLTPKLCLLKYDLHDDDEESLYFEGYQDGSDGDDDSVWKFSENLFKSMMEVLVERENQNRLVVKLPEDVIVSVSHETQDANKNLLELEIYQY